MTKKLKTTVRKMVLGVEAPKKAYNLENRGKNCPFTGNLSVKKETLVGTIIKKDINKSATIERQMSRYVPKYERYEFAKSRLRVHNPLAVDAQVGDVVLVARTRPISKTKNHVVLKVIKGSEEFSASEKLKKSEKKDKDLKKQELKKPLEEKDNETS